MNDQQQQQYDELLKKVAETVGDRNKRPAVAALITNTLGQALASLDEADGELDLTGIIFAFGMAANAAVNVLTTEATAPERKKSFGCGILTYAMHQEIQITHVEAQEDEFFGVQGRTVQ